MTMLDHRPLGFGAAGAPADAGARDGRFLDLVAVAGLVLLQFQVVQFGPAQPAHVWLLFTLGLMIYQGAFVASRADVAGFLFFFAYVAIVTTFVEHDRIKAFEQLLKFGLIYPGLYFVGRWLGAVYTLRPLPIGPLFLIAVVLFEVVVQTLAVPVIHQPLDFGQGAIHGTFRERNWLAVYVFLFSWFLFEAAELRGVSENRRAAMLLAVNLVALYFSQSKTAIVAAGILLLLRSRQPIVLKLLAIAGGAAVYWVLLAREFSEQNIQVRLEEERGLAFLQAVKLIADEPFGHGVGFVEAYFTNLPLWIRGLGANVNSVFSTPLDLMIIAGPVGLAFWLVFFAGFGNRLVLTLAPLAALSLLNPMHQSEIVWLFMGMLVSQARLKREMAAVGVLPVAAPAATPALSPAVQRRFGRATARAARSGPARGEAT